MENYIVINGRKAELTEEQLKALGIEIKKKSLFDRAKKGERYHFINWSGNVNTDTEMGSDGDDRIFNVANYCTDKELLQQQAYREILNRLLWRYSMEHDGDKIDWNSDNLKFFIYRCIKKERFDVDYQVSWKLGGVVYFHTRETAENAIEEIIEPFMAEHPDFKW